MRGPIVIDSRWVGRVSNFSMVQSHLCLSSTVQKASSKPNANAIKATASTVIPLLEIYRNLHQHVSVPTSFIVPAEEPWPSHLYGFTLGFHLGVLRKYRRVIPLADEIRLTELGMCWSESEIMRVEKFLRAVSIYKALNGNVDIPKKYVVPSDSTEWPTDLRGFRLGYFIGYIEKGVYSAHMKRFQDLGLEHRLTGKLIDLKKALEVYKGLYGHCNLPYRFPIAKDDTNYPESIRGGDLGLRSGRIFRRRSLITEEQIQQFKALGLTVRTRDDTVAEHICSAIQCFRKVYGPTRIIPYAFIVPEGSESYPPELWGLKLGHHVHRISTLGEFPAHHDRFRALGIVIDDQRKKDFKFLPDLVAEVLPIYRSIYGNALVPPSFVVPKGEPWPIELEKFPLGQKITYLRGKRKHLMKRDYQLLVEAGMVWKRKEFFHQCLVEGTERFKNLYGHVKVPQDFIVPTDDSQWPPHLRGLNLGKRLYRRIHGRLSDEERALWMAMGVDFTWDRRPGRPQMPFEEVKEAFRVYQVQHGTFDVPLFFEVPQDDESYPESVRGKQLGQLLQRIRRRQIYLERRPELEAMGVHVKLKAEIQAELICEALQCYRQWRGDLQANVPIEFVVPTNSTHFPQKMWGLALGKLCDRVVSRNLHARCRDMFIAVGLLPKL